MLLVTSIIAYTTVFSIPALLFHRRDHTNNCVQRVRVFAFISYQVVFFGGGGAKQRRSRGTVQAQHSPRELNIDDAIAVC